jgi:signal transduction histidine kinase
VTSNARRAVTFFLEERLDALRFLTKEMKFETFKDSVELAEILRNLKIGFGGFVDLGLINSAGVQISYAGPFDLEGKIYSDQDWYIRSVEAGSFVSDVFRGYRGLPHMIIASKTALENGAFYILRATLDMKKLAQMLSSLEISKKTDIFLSNHEGLLQTPSRYYGDPLESIKLPIPGYSLHSQSLETQDKAGNRILLGYAYIENSPFILMLVKRSKEIMEGWHSIRKEINWFFAASVIVILLLVFSISTIMVNKIYDADLTRLKAMERLESSSRLISVGRLAAGVAHEINNPLAIIGENAGLIKDLFTLKKEYEGDPRLMQIIDDVLESVERCGEITKQLLGFATHFEPKIQPLQIHQVLQEVLSFLRKEASYRNITICFDIPDDLPVVYSDRSKLQQIFLNLINNAFQAMKDGGRLLISAREREERIVSVNVTDDGCGISEEDQKTIFEPFFTTRASKGGTGLGLSITYGLLQKLNGDISVHSKLGEGTTFTVDLPINSEAEIRNESADC